MTQATLSSNKRRQSLQTGVILRHVIINIFVVIILLPVAWVLLLSIKSLPDAYSGKLWPENFDFTHYAYVWAKIDTLPTNLFNSVYVTLATVAITSICSILAGYALVHLELRGRAIVIIVLTATLYFPTRVVSLIAIYYIQDAVNLLDTTTGLILPYVTLNLAISILIMRGIFEQIPHELVDAAKVDGCNAWQTLMRVMLPLIKNGLVVIVVVNFVSAWGEYLLAATLTNSQDVRTLPVVLASAHGGLGAWAWPRIGAVYVIAITPGIIVFAFLQKLYYKGLTEGALKF